MSRVFDSGHGRILCIADIRGRLSALNDLAKEANAVAIVHTGDFGFFEQSSLDRISDRTLRHLTMYSPLISPAQRTSLLNADQFIRGSVTVAQLSEFPLLLAGRVSLNVPVYTVCGACEDVSILEKFRTGAYSIPNLNIIDEATSHLLDIAGLKLRLLGIGGALVPHKMFDNGDANATIAGGQGTIWLTALQLGELVDTAQRVFDPSETRLLVTHASPGREGIISQLSLLTKADLTISAGLHFRYSTSWNEFSIQSDYDGLRHKLLAGKDAFDKVWESVKTQVDAVVDDNQRVLLDKALAVVERIPAAATGTTNPQDEGAWKNCWNWNLCDAAYGSLVLDLNQGRVSAELRSQGFNYAYRRSATVPATPTSATPGAILPATGGAKTPLAIPSKSTTPAPAAVSAPAPNAASTSASDRALPPHMTPNTNGAPAAITSGTGTATGSLTPSSDTQDTGTKFSERQKKKDKKDRKERPTGAASHQPNPSTASTTNSAPLASDSGLKSPQSGSAPSPSPSSLAPNPTSGAGSTGTRTPRTPKPTRNPYTLFLRLSNTTSEASLRTFFGPAGSGITRITFPATTSAGRAQKLAYVEFGDEETMKKALNEHPEEIEGGGRVDVKVAQDKETREREREKERSQGHNQNQGGEGQNSNSASSPVTNSNSGPPSSNYRGRGRGRGRGGSGDGGRGGYALRGLAAAGLTKGSRGGGPGSGGGGAGGGNANGEA